MTAPLPQVPLPQPPPGEGARAATAPTSQSTGDPEIDAALQALTGLDPEDLDAHLSAGAALHDLLRSRLADSGE